MKDRPAGSYIDDGEGNLKPNLADEAMKKRAGTVPELRTEQSEVVDSGLSLDSQKVKKGGK
jgi:hypothetical protein